MDYVLSPTFPWGPTYGRPSLPMRLPPLGPYGRLLRVVPYGILAYLVWEIYREMQDRAETNPINLPLLPPGWVLHADCNGDLELSTYTAFNPGVCGDGILSKPLPAYNGGAWYSTWKYLSDYTPTTAWYRKGTCYHRLSGTVPFSRRAAPVEVPSLRASSPSRRLEEALAQLYPQFAPKAARYPASGAVPWAWVPALPTVDAYDGVDIRGNAEPRRRGATAAELVAVKPRPRPSAVPAHVLVAEPGKALDYMQGLHVLGRPGPRTKERKLKPTSVSVSKLIWDGINHMTEGCDLVKALYDALPYTVRSQYDKKAAAKGRYTNWVRWQKADAKRAALPVSAPQKKIGSMDWRSGAQACAWKAAIVAKEADAIDWNKAVKNIAREAFTDIVVANVSKGTQPISKLIGRGVQTGPWDNINFDVSVPNNY